VSAKRKRRPGAGRPKGGPTRPLTVRIPTKVRAELEAAAKERGRKLTQWNLTKELVLRLRTSFVQDRDRSGNPAMRALCFLLLELGEAVHSNVPDWRSNPFLFRAFKVATAKLLDALEPPGDADKPPDSFVAVWKDAGNWVTEEWIARRMESPASLAEQAAANVLSAYNKIYAPDTVWEDAMRALDIDPESLSIRLQSSLKRSFYGMADAQNDLAIKPQKGKS
jgi:hypothetical protein